MKFGRQLEQYQLPEWQGHYIPYNELKRELEGFKLRSSKASASADSLLSPTEIEQELRAWRGRVESEALRVGDFVDRGLHGLADQLCQLSMMVDSLQAGSFADEYSSDAGKEDQRKDRQRENIGLEDASDETQRKDGGSEHQHQALEDIEVRAIEGVGRVVEGMRRLRGFAELNHATLYKILKKHDKTQHSTLGLATLFPKVVADSHLDDMTRFDKLDAEVRRLSLASSKTDGLNASPEVARLAAGLGFQSHAPRGSTQNELVLSFFFGLSVAFMISIGILLWLPETDPDSFSACYFLVSMPVFRVVFSVLLILWCLGFVVRTCDKADINVMFILRIDPKCQVTSDWIFSRAAILTTLWVLAFGMYVLDYKWGILRANWSGHGYNSRASAHFVLYPLLLLICTLLGILARSVVCRNRYKIGVLRSIGRTMAAPFFPVDFADNIVGDVLTSLAKPLQDIPAATCYLLQPHPQTPELMARFKADGHTCNVSAMAIIMPLIAGLPYLFRALQCLRRYRDSATCKNPDIKHLFNLGKYAISLCVVLVGAVCPERIIVVTVISVVATVYAGLWDLAIDWGLGRKEFFGLETVLTELRERIYSGGDELTCDRRNSDQQDSGGPTEDPSPGKLSGVDDSGRFLSKHVYWICSVLDIILRCTWVFTLMPLHIYTKNIIGRTVFVSMISSAEVIRRSVWAVLRIENEQVSNASGFRALLWVPSKLNAEDGRRRSVLKHANSFDPLLTDH